LPGLPRRGDQIFEWFSLLGSADRVGTRNSCRSRIEPLISSESFRFNRFRHRDTDCDVTDTSRPGEAEMLEPGLRPFGDKTLGSLWSTAYRPKSTGGQHGVSHRGYFGGREING
jgi:hypothetical protein